MRFLEGVERVWSVAFGSGSTKEDFSVMWRHLKVDKGLLLATGHQNGNIKVWDCNTGKNIYQVFFNRIGSVMVSMLALNAVDCGSKP